MTPGLSADALPPPPRGVRLALDGAGRPTAPVPDGAPWPGWFAVMIGSGDHATVGRNVYLPTL